MVANSVSGVNGTLAVIIMAPQKWRILLLVRNLGDVRNNATPLERGKT
jgi:hypothetical protein